MDSNTWTTTLTFETKPDDIRHMREWLDEYAQPIPSRNADVLAKFIRCTINNNAQWDGVRCEFAVKRPQLMPPWQHEWGPEEDADGFPEPRSNLALAVDGCAALMVLACIGLMATHAFTHSPHTPAPWYDTAHATTHAAKPDISSR